MVWFVGYKAGPKGPFQTDRLFDVSHPWHNAVHSRMHAVVWAAVPQHDHGPFLPASSFTGEQYSAKASGKKKLM